MLYSGKTYNIRSLELLPRCVFFDTLSISSEVYIKGVSKTITFTHSENNSVQ